MNFSSFDMMVLVTMSLAVIGMSFTFPALGLTDADTNESDIPEFDINNDRFDFAGSFPENPGTPNGGTLEYDANGSDRDEVTLHETSDGELIIWALLEVDPDSDNLRVVYSEYDSGNVTSEHYWFNESDQHTADEYGMEVRFELISADPGVTNTTEAEVRYTILEEPTGGSGWLDRIPIVGAVVDAGDSLAQIVGWIGSVIWWLGTASYEILVNVVGMLYDVTSYLFATATWLFDTYTEIISSAESWASVFVAIPGILLMLELTKLVMLAIKLLPTT